jgi:putative ABC transport system permease protein
MPSFRAVWQRFRNVFRKPVLDGELDEELASHLALHTQENVRAGMTPDDARREALMKLGGVEQAKEAVRDARDMGWLKSSLKDVRFGQRMLRRNAGFTAIAVLALALGIGFSTTVFSIFYNGVLHPFAYRDADRLTVIWIIDTAHNSERSRAMYHLNEIAAFRKQSQSFEDVVAYSGWDTTFLNHGTPESVHICVSTPNMISFWGMRPIL